MSSSFAWQIALLMTQPPLSAAYLLWMRAGAPASRLAVAIFALLPAVAFAIGWRSRSRLDAEQRRWNSALLGLAIVEIAWSGVTLAIVDFAAAWRLD